MNREISNDNDTHIRRQVLGNLTNTLGKRLNPFDLETSTLKGKEIVGCEKNTSPVAKRRTGNYFSLESSSGFTMENHRVASNNRGQYFSNTTSELGAEEGNDLKGREQSPDSELNLEEDYESENEEPLRHNTSFSSNAFSALNTEVLKLGCAGVQEKSCSCSFCVKAAYMWTDLHFQDARGRLSALKRSRRLARVLEGKLLHAQQFNRKVLAESSKQTPNMELELMNQWRSLFLHTEHMFSRETSDLVSKSFTEMYWSDEYRHSTKTRFSLSKHSTLLNLEQLRENCKRDLHSVSGLSGPHNG